MIFGVENHPSNLSGIDELQRLLGMAQDELAKRGVSLDTKRGDGGYPPGNSYIHIYIFISIFIHIYISHQKSLLTFDLMIFPTFRLVGYVFSFPRSFFWGEGTDSHAISKLLRW